MKTIMNHKTKLMAVSVALFALVAIFVIGNVRAEKAQACDTGCYPDVSGYCDVDVSEATVGQSVTFTGHGEGGNSQYVYNWTGTDGLSANTRSVSHTYTTAGTKSATVRITSNSQSIFKTCSVVIKDKSTPPPPCSTGCYPDVGGDCSVDVSDADIGETVTFTAEGTGGNNEYVYNWTGTDGLSANTRSVSHSYSTSGTKSATVRITSNSQSVFKTCSVTINPKNNPSENLGGYCEGRPSTVDEDEKVTWTAYPEGGDGSYDYDWSGDDDLDGSDKSITHRYDDSGTKEARVTITSDGQSVTKSCNVKVEKEDHDNDDLDAYCEASPSVANIGEKVKFTVHASDGKGSYKYSWDGDDNLDGDDKSITHTYRTAGTKEATVKVKDDNDDVKATCHVNIQGDSVIYVPPTQSGVYLDTIPATGINPTVKTALFLSGTLIWSAFLGYIYVLRRKMKLKEQRMIDEASNG